MGNNTIEKIEKELEWDDMITKESGDFILLPEGDYNFVAESFERGRHPGSPKLPPCNKAIINLRIDAPEGSIKITHNLFLHTKTEGMLSAFFSSIGLKKKGEPLKMNWNHVPGSYGKCKVGIRTYKPDEGEERKYNEIKQFYPKEAGPAFKAGEF